MKLPIPFLLYTTSLGLVGFTGWQIYELLPLQRKETKDAAIAEGQKAAKDKVSLGRSEGQVSADWFYTGWVREGQKAGNRWWWKQLRETNFIGKPPPPPPVEPGEETGPVEVPPPPVIPLEEILELTVLVYDSQDEGKGKLSHVVVQYKPQANVVPPEWYVREMQSATTPGTGGAWGPRDGVPPPKAGGNQNFQGGNRGRGARGSRGANAQGTPMPVAQGTTSSVQIQKIWVQGGDDPRRSPSLWPPYAHIRLVRVAPDAQSAFFVREAEPKEGEEPAEPQEEQLFKTAADLSQELLKALSELDGRERAGATGGPAAPAPDAWVPMDDTQVVGNRWNVGRKDQEEFDKEDEFLERVYLDTYVSPVSSRRGLIVRNVDPKLATRYGVARGDVLLRINDHPVRTKSEAIQFGKGEYKKGVRLFTTEWLSGGQIVTRVYQLPDE